MSKKLIRIFVTAFILVIFWLIFQYMQARKLEEESVEMKASGLPVVVTVFYETLCPDSKNFIVRQLTSTYERLPHLVDVEYVPYGKAKTKINKDGSLSFECQHSQIECEGNIVHACVIEVIKDPAVKLNMISCMIKDNVIPKDIFHRCAKEYSVDDTDSQKIITCAESPHGKELLKVYGEQTHALKPAISFIPTILLDGSQRNQAKVLKDLKHEVCEVLSDHGPKPDACK